MFLGKTYKVTSLCRSGDKMEKESEKEKTILEIIENPYGDLCIRIDDCAFGSSEFRNEMKASLIHLLEGFLKIDWGNKKNTKAIENAIDKLTFVEELVD